MPVKIILMVLEDRLYYDKRPILDYKIQYPQFFSNSYQKNLTKINKYYYRKALEVQKQCTDNYFKAGIENYNNSIKTKTLFRLFKIFYIPTITYNNNCAISLYIDNYISLGGIHGITIRTSDTWNIKDGELIPLCELFNYNIDEVNLLRQFIENQVETDIKLMGPLYYENYRENIINNFRVNNFFLLPIGIVIFFQQYDIAPFAAGIREFIMPYEKGVTIEPQCRY